jgi:hypothetical protein
MFAKQVTLVAREFMEICFIFSAFVSSYFFRRGAFGIRACPLLDMAGQ